MRKFSSYGIKLANSGVREAKSTLEIRNGSLGGIGNARDHQPFGHRRQPYLLEPEGLRPLDRTDLHGIRWTTRHLLCSITGILAEYWLLWAPPVVRVSAIVG